MDPSINILIVDDEPKNLRVLESLLDDADYRLVRAESAEAALMALVTEEEFALLILDIQMPGMTGFELAQMIKQRRRTQHIPIIFLTAHYREDEHAVLGYDVGAVDYLTKPINPQVLRSKVNVFVELFKKTRALAAMNRTAQAAEDALRIANVELAARNEGLLREAEERERRIRAELAQAEAEEANAAKDRFLAMLSHELRTPLSPIVHAVTLLEEIDCPPEIREHIDTIQRNVRLEARLIDDLLDLARIRNGKLRLELQSVEVHEVLRQAIKICQAELTKRGIQVVEKLEAGAAQVRGDFARLQQVFWNVLTNAAKFSPDGSSIEVRTRVTEPGSLVVIEIVDQGIGISPEKVDRIFDAFEQGAQRSQTGLGLGLAICKALVQMHSGDISVRSEGMNCGSTFTIQLIQSAVESQPSEVRKTEPEPLPGVRLLVVEDHQDTLNTLIRLLKRRGYFIRTASSIAEALEVAREYDFQVLISDIGLPDGRGTELVEQLTAMRGQRPAAIAMSGFGMDDDVERSRQAGFSEHLTKPIEFAALHQAISRLVHLSASPQEALVTAP
ncbi:MAG: response regulator [Verrucomicrobiota bacterium]